MVNPDLISVRSLLEDAFEEEKIALYRMFLAKKAIDILEEDPQNEAALFELRCIAMNLAGELLMRQALQAAISRIPRQLSNSSTIRPTVTPSS